MDQPNSTPTDRVLREYSTKNHDTKNCAILVRFSLASNGGRSYTYLSGLVGPAAWLRLDSRRRRNDVETRRIKLMTQWTAEMTKNMAVSAYDWRGAGSSNCNNLGLFACLFDFTFEKSLHWQQCKLWVGTNTAVNKLSTPLRPRERVFLLRRGFGICKNDVQDVRFETAGFRLMSADIHINI